jgi:hypothetical protein
MTDTTRITTQIIDIFWINLCVYMFVCVCVWARARHIKTVTQIPEAQVM